MLSVVPAAVAAHYLSGFLLNERLNIVPGPFRIIPLAIAIQIVVGLLIPILAALMPMLAATRITPRQVINSYGLGSGFGQNRFDHYLGKIRHLPRPLALSLRNTFSHKKRISLTLITLTLGGVMFITVMSIGASLNNTIDGLVEDFGYDIQVEVEGNHDVSQLIEIGQGVKGVSAAEVWGKWPITLHLPDDHSADDEESWGYVWGIPNDTQLYSANLVSGRRLMLGDEQVILLNNAIAAAEGIQVGDTVFLNIGGKLTEWTVVGLILNINNFGREHIAPFGTLANLTGQAGQGSKIAMGIEPNDARNAQEIVRDIHTSYEKHQLTVLSSAIGEEERKGVKAMFSSIVYLMLVLAIMAGIIGSIGLASTISINVSERRRELGVMRAIGARSTTILGIVIIEGMLVGVLSWFLALPFTFPLAHLSSNAIGDLLFKTQLDYSYSVNGMVAWVVIVLLLSTLASLWPARGAARMSVHQSLTYE
jgi:putative ABC transport system permease protein